PADDYWAVCPYRTFEELADRMSTLIPSGNFDVVVHAAAVSDYCFGGAYIPGPGTRFDLGTVQWRSDGGRVQLQDAAAGKMKSHHPEMWLRLTPTPKLVDQIRHPWGFGGILVKFKLEVGIGEGDLLVAAERARCHSGADLMVANSLEEMQVAAYVGPC